MEEELYTAQDPHPEQSVASSMVTQGTPGMLLPMTAMENVAMHTAAKPKTYNFEGAVKAGVPLVDIVNASKVLFPEYDADTVMANSKDPRAAAKGVLEQFYKKQAEDVEAYDNGQKTVRQLQEGFKTQLREQRQGIVSEPTDTESQRFNDFSNGVKSSMLGAKQTLIDFHMLLGTDKFFSTDGEGWENINAENIANIEDLNKVIKDQDFFSTNTLGKLLPSLVTLPVMYQSKVLAALTEGSLGYAEARGTNMSKGQSLAVGTVAGGATAGFMKLVDMWSKRGISKTIVDLVENGSEEDLTKYLKTVEMSDDLGLGDEAIAGSRGMPSNIFEQQAMYDEALPKFEAKLTEAVKDTIPETSIDDAAEALSEGAEGLKAGMKQETKDAYSAVEALATNDQKYSYSNLKNTMIEKLKSSGAPSEVMNVIKREILYNVKNMTDPQKAISKKMFEIKDAVDAQKVDLMLLEDGSAAYNRLHADIIKNLRDLGTLQKKLPNIDTISEQELMRLRAAISRKKNISGGAISTSDKAEQAALGEALTVVDDFISAETGASNPMFHKLFKSARGKAAEDFNTFGYGNKGNKDYPELGKILETDDVNKITEGVLNNTYRMEKIVTALSGQNPSIGKKFAEALGSKALKGIKYNKSGLIDYDRFDIVSLSNHLEKIVKDPQTSAFMKKNLDSTQWDNLNAIYDITKGLSTVIKDLPQGGPLGKGAFNYIGEGNGIVGSLGRVAKLGIDSITAIKGNILGFKPAKDTMLRLTKLIEKGLDKPQNVGAIQRLTRSLSRWSHSKNNVESVIKDIAGLKLSKEETANRVNAYIMNAKEPNAKQLAKIAKIPEEDAGKIIDDIGLERNFDVAEVLDDGTKVINYGGKRVDVRMNKDGTINVDTSEFMPGTGTGKKFYNELWDYMDKTGMKYNINPSELSEVNTYRLAVNMLDRLTTKPKTAAFSKVEANDIVASAVSKVDDELSRLGAPLLKDLTEAGLKKYGKTFGETTNMQLPYRSLKQLQRRAKLVDSRVSAATTKTIKDFAKANKLDDATASKLENYYKAEFNQKTLSDGLQPGKVTTNAKKVERFLDDHAKQLAEDLTISTSRARELAEQLLRNGCE